MKLLIGGSRGVPIPKLINPIIFLVTALGVAFVTAFMVLLIAVLVLVAPFAWMLTIRKVD